MHLPRARINAGGSRARVLVFFSRTRWTILQEGSTMQLQPNRGNLYDGAFNRSIKTVLVGWDRTERIVRAYREEVRSLADRNLYDYSREYIVVQRHHKYIAWTLRTCFTSRQKKKRQPRLLTTGVFLDTYRFSDDLAKSNVYLRFQAYVSTANEQVDFTHVSSRYAGQFLTERNPLACSRSTRDTRCQIVSPLVRHWERRYARTKTPHYDTFSFLKDIDNDRPAQ